jgi:hypothetical protein
MATKNLPELELALLSIAVMRELDDCPIEEGVSSRDIWLLRLLRILSDELERREINGKAKD